MSIPGSEHIAPQHLRISDISFLQKEKPFIFCVVRNPWTRLISWYEMMVRKGGHNDFSTYLLSRDSQDAEAPPFSDFIRRTSTIHETYINEHARREANSTASFTWKTRYYVKSLAFNQIDYLTDNNGHFCCDRILRFENIENDFSALWRDLGLDSDLKQDASLPLLNSNPKKINVHSYYKNEADIQWVEALYSKDIQKFGYSFERQLHSPLEQHPNA